MWIWYLDRGSALAAYVLLWLAVISGVLHGARKFGALHVAARRIHVSTSVLACVTLLLHVGVGAWDTGLVVRGVVPHPAYTSAYFALGLVVGVGALLLIVTSVIGFLDAKRFQRPWDPRAVHALAYGGFAFATVHAVALGSDIGRFVVTGMVAIGVFTIYVLTLRMRVAREAGPAAGSAPGTFSKEP